MPRNFKYISEARFHELVKKLGSRNMPETSIAAAKAVMVDKEVITLAAEKNGMHEASLRRIIRNIHAVGTNSRAITLIAMVDEKVIHEKEINEKECSEIFLENNLTK